MTRAQRRVLQSAVERTPITRNTNEAVDQRSSLGDRVADGVARFGGSRGFIIGFIACLVSWVVLNVVLPGRKTFDPDPFTFLNLLLSTVAAIQAPIIKMARNRQARHDRVDAAHDHEVNPKAEIESMALHDTLDQPSNDQLVTILDRIEALAGSIRRLEGEGSRGNDGTAGT
ncbi:DUF1003 domain-containing protein [Luteimonas marina]|uniref:DUF1003 domain-containing protein n=1 Tax=Luteimonas marina TaxID=488485 RepID=UPI00192DEDF6|nr:DUF1003 domain-containing protein [Luteimonas marina]